MSGLSLRFLSKLHFKFSPFDEASISTREVMRRLTSSKLLATNDKVDIQTTITPRGTPPTITIVWADKSQQDYQAGGRTAASILSELEARSKTLALQSLKR